MPGWQWTYWALWVSQLVAMIAFAAVLPFMPLFVQELGIADPGDAAAWAGAIASAAALTQAAMAPIWGVAADRYGPKLMVTRSIVSGGVVVTAMALVADVGQLLLLRGVQGVFAGTLSAARVLVASIVPREKLGQSLGLMATSAFVGSSAGPVLGGFVADRYGFRATFLVTGTLLLLAGMAVIALVRERLERPSESARGGWQANVRVLAEVPQVRAIVASIFVVQAGETAVAPVLALFVKELTGGSTATASIAGMVVGAGAVTGAAAAVLVGRLGDRVGHRRVLIVVALGGGLLYLPQAFVSGPWELLALRAAAGAFLGGILTLELAIVGLVTPPERRGWVFGLTATAMALGNAAGPLVGALAASAFGLRAPFVVAGLALLAAGAWVASAVRAPR